MVSQCALLTRTISAIRPFYCLLAALFQWQGRGEVFCCYADPGWSTTRCEAVVMTRDSRGSQQSQLASHITAPQCRHLPAQPAGGVLWMSTI